MNPGASGGALESTPPANGLLIVLVLYRRTPQESEAFASLSALVAEEPRWQDLTCLVWDNSPAPAELPPTPFPSLYTHDPSNPGLARPYQKALELAQSRGIAWLMLLDQDTALTRAFLADTFSTMAQHEAEPTVVALVPKLVQGEDVLSPHLPFGTRSTTDFRFAEGVLTEPVHVYNSGSVLRVSAVVDAGGFPQAYPFDYLDHAVYTRLQDRLLHGRRRLRLAARMLLAGQLRAALLVGRTTLRPR